MIEQLVKTLRSNQIDATAEDIADALWLVLQIQKSVQLERVSADTALNRTLQDQDSGSSPLSDMSECDQQITEDRIPQETEPVSRLHPKTSQERGARIGSGGLPIRSPAARTLPGELALARAMRPLMRRIASRTTMMFDELATVHFIAEQHIWIALEQPAPERWFTVDLVVDESHSMVVWQQTIVELRRLLERHGAFRNVRVWGLKTDINDTILHLYPETGSFAQQQRSYSPEQLSDPIGRTLVLVVSDCVSSVWRQGKVTDMLNIWGQHSPVAIVQVLPQRMWNGSVLGLQTIAHFSAPAPGLPNIFLKAIIPNLLDEEEQPTGVQVPVLTLEPESLMAWAQVVSGVAGACVTGCLLELGGGGQDNEDIHQQSARQALTAEERVERFQVIASPTAQKLAGYLSAAPLTLPVMRLVQQVMLPESRQVHLAEVFLGGLLRQLSPADERNPNLIQYDFIDDQVRECFLDRVLLPDAIEVLRQISTYVEKHMGQVLDFEAILEDPDALGELVIDDQTRPFAKVTARVLRRLGGKICASGMDG